MRHHFAINKATTSHAVFPQKCGGSVVELVEAGNKSAKQPRKPESAAWQKWAS